MKLSTTLKTLLILLLTITFFNCSNDDDINNPPVNANGCTFAGFTFEDMASNTQTLIPEADLTTQYLAASSNGPEVEVYQTNSPGNFNFTTTVVTLNATGTGTLNYNGNTYTVNVICQLAGTNIGDEFRFDITASGLEAELCVVIDVI